MYLNYFQVRGQEVEIIGEHCNEFGIKVLNFSRTSGPIYHYLEPTNSSFGDQPHLRDPLNKKYVYVKKSDIPKAEEGLFALKDIQPNTVFVLYSGMLFDEYQRQIYTDKKFQMKEKNNWRKDDPRFTDLMMNRYEFFLC